MPTTPASAMHLRSRCNGSARRARAAGSVLPLVLVMLSLAALMTSAGLERSMDRSLLASGATARGSLHETAAAALAAGIRDAEALSCAADFPAAKNGRYAEAGARWGTDYPWAAAADAHLGEDGVTAGFIIERLAYRADGARCRLLVTAGVRAGDGDELFGQALLSPPQASPDAVRIFAPSR